MCIIPKGQPPDLRKRKKASSTLINHKWQSLLCGRKRFTILHLTSAIPWSIARSMIARGLLYLLAEMDCWVSNPAFNIPNYAPASSYPAAILWVVFSIKCDIVIEIYGILYMAFWTNQNFYKLSYVCKLPSFLEGNGPYIATCHKYMTHNRRLRNILQSVS